MRDEAPISVFMRRLKTAAAYRNVTLTDLARHCGVSRQAMDKMPSSSRLMQMCQKLDVSADYLLGADDVDAQIDALLHSEIVPKTARQLYLEQTNN